MKILNFYKQGAYNLGIEKDGKIIDVLKTANRLQITAPKTTDEVIGHGKTNDLLPLLGSPVYVENVEYAPAVLNPGKILCVGLNYKSHADETAKEVPKYPVLFSKFNNALAAHNQSIALPTCALNFDYEAELVVVVGKTAKNISCEDAADYIFGYTLGNDVSARDLQYRSGQWLIGKSCDQFAPIGPFITTSDEVNPGSIRLTSKVNGELRQDATTSDMIFSCNEILSYASSIMTLYPGDIIFTGTPAGVIMGYPKEKQVWLKAGDNVEISAEGLGVLSNTFI